MATRSSHTNPGKPFITLAVDIGGSGIKGLLLDHTGGPISERLRITTPNPSTPKAVLTTINKLARELGKFDRVSVGFPGVIQHGLVKTAPNLHATWPSTPLVKELEKRLSKPVRAANDADVQGFGAIKGQGVELVITLGTGFGTALFVNGQLVPNIEIAHHPFRKGNTYEEELGAGALQAVGKKKWNQRLAEAIEILDRVINFDYLHIGGGNGKKVTLELPPNVNIIPNVAGLLGGIALWNHPSNSTHGTTKTLKTFSRKSPAKRNAAKRRPRG